MSPNRTEIEVTHLPDDVVERCERAVTLELERLGVAYGQVDVESVARAALEAARYGEMREALAYWMSREHLLPDITIDDVVFRTKSRALLSTIGEPNPDLGATQP